MSTPQVTSSIIAENLVSTHVYRPTALSPNLAEGLSPEFTKYVITQSLLHQGGFSSVLETVTASDIEVNYQLSDVTVTFDEIRETEQRKLEQISESRQSETESLPDAYLWERGLELIAFLSLNNFTGYTFAEETTYVSGEDIIFGAINQITRQYTQGIIPKSLTNQNQGDRTKVTYTPVFLLREEPTSQEKEQFQSNERTLEQSISQKQKDIDFSANTLLGLCRKINPSFDPYWVEASPKLLSYPVSSVCSYIKPFMKTAILYFGNGEHFLRAFDVYARLCAENTSGILPIDLPLLAKIVTAKVFDYPLGPEIHLLSTNKALHRLELQVLHILGWYLQTGPLILPPGHAEDIRTTLGNISTSNYLQYNNYRDSYIHSMMKISNKPNIIKEFCSGQLDERAVHWVTITLIEDREYVRIGKSSSNPVPNIRLRDEDTNIVRNIINAKKYYIAVAAVYIDRIYRLPFLRIVSLITLFAHMYPAQFPDVVSTTCPNAYKILLNQYLPDYLMGCMKEHGMILCDPRLVKTVVENNVKLYTHTLSKEKKIEKIEANCNYYPLSDIYFKEPPTVEFDNSGNEEYNFY